MHLFQFVTDAASFKTAVMSGNSDSVHVLDADGHEIGQEAVDFMNGTQPGDIGLILMDVMMPVMGGYDATRALRRSDKPWVAGITIIAMTANAFEKDKKAAIEAGINDHPAKPFRTDKLYEMMKKSLK